MPLVDLTRVVNSPYFAQDFVVVRSSGIFAFGTFAVTSIENIPFYGTIQPATQEELQKVKEGDRVTGAMSFIAEARMFHTHTDGIGTESGLSDQITWRDQTYSLVDVNPWKDFGFWKAIGLRVSGT